MIQRRTRVRRNLLAVLFVGLLPISLQATDVHLKNGSIRSGQPDASTNESSLRLRVGEPDAYIVFGIPWDEIAEVCEGNEVWGPEHFDALRKRWVELPDDQKDIRDRDQQPAEPAKPAAARPLWAPPRAAGPHELLNSRMRLIEIDAVAANWDTGVEWDGIVLRVWPLDQFGNVVRVPGTLEATLISNEPGFDGRWHGDDNQRIGHWARSVRVSDYGPDSVSFKLDFQNYHPERTNAPWHPDCSIATHSEVHVKLTVPGHGVFRASTGPVRIRRFSALRDHYFRRSGTRFFHYEW